MHQSFLQYSITKPYPQRWFTPAVLIGGIALTVLVSFGNYASNAFYLRTTYTGDPNTTAIANNRWYFNTPFNDDPTKCDSKLVTVGTTFFTTNLGFSYEITGISLLDNEGTAVTALPSILYHNNILDDCYTRQIHIDLLKEGLANPPFWWISWRNSFTTATFQCSAASESGISNIILQVKYYVSTSLIDSNSSSHASAWWGISLLRSTWYGVMTSMCSIRQFDNNSIRDPDLFDIKFAFITEKGQIINNYEDGRGLELINNDSAVFSPVLTEALYFAKLMHSLAMLDLGNSQLSNFLLDDESLRYVTSGSGNINRQPGGIFYDYVSWANGGLLGEIISPFNGSQFVPINESYAALSSLVGPLGTNSSTIFAQYICSIPTRKSAGSLLLAIILADLVFLQAGRKIFDWGVQAVMTRQDPTTMICAGCLASRAGDTMEVKEVKENSYKLISMSSATSQQEDGLLG
ncbi:hypothetical protein EV127DRAFT_340643 [Xylaria flabelliformis]|nr:hypothetical protein EV127DRAFT_340643 [Xylaria flabelliformis]